MIKYAILAIVLISSSALAEKDRDLFLSGGSNGLGAQYRVVNGRFALHAGLLFEGDFAVKNDSINSENIFSLNSSPFFGIGAAIIASEKINSILYLDLTGYVRLSHEDVQFKLDSSLDRSGLYYDATSSLGATYEQFWLKNGKTIFGAGLGSGLYNTSSKQLNLRALAYLMVPIKSWSPKQDSTNKSLQHDE